MKNSKRIIAEILLSATVLGFGTQVAVSAIEYKSVAQEQNVTYCNFEDPVKVRSTFINTMNSSDPTFDKILCTVRCAEKIGSKIGYEEVTNVLNILALPENQEILYMLQNYKFGNIDETNKILSTETFKIYGNCDPKVLRLILSVVLQAGISNSQTLNEFEQVLENFYLINSEEGPINSKRALTEILEWAMCMQGPYVKKTADVLNTIYTSMTEQKELPNSLDSKFVENSGLEMVDYLQKNNLYFPRIIKCVADFLTNVDELCLSMPSQSLNQTVEVKSSQIYNQELRFTDLVSSTSLLEVEIKVKREAESLQLNLRNKSLEKTKKANGLTGLINKDKNLPKNPDISCINEKTKKVNEPTDLINKDKNLPKNPDISCIDEKTKKNNRSVCLISVDKSSIKNRSASYIKKNIKKGNIILNTSANSKCTYSLSLNNAIKRHLIDKECLLILFKQTEKELFQNIMFDSSFYFDFNLNFLIDNKFIDISCLESFIKDCQNQLGKNDTELYYKSWTTEESRIRHYKKHKKDVGVETEKQYTQKAIDLLRNIDDWCCFHIEKSENGVYYLVVISNDFKKGVYCLNGQNMGRIVTFFRMDKDKDIRNKQWIILKPDAFKDLLQNQVEKQSTEKAVSDSSEINPEKDSTDEVESTSVDNISEISLTDVSKPTWKFNAKSSKKTEFQLTTNDTSISLPSENSTEFIYNTPKTSLAQ